MSIRLGSFSMDFNIMAHPNVSVSPRYKNEDKTKFQTHRDMYTIIHPLLTARPTWRFVATDLCRTDDKVVFNGFQVFEDGELLGKVGITYIPRSHTYKIVVDNERIGAKRQRGTGYRTENAEKALLAVRKSFFRMGAIERVSKVRELAATILSSEHDSKMYDMHRAESSLLANYKEFVMQRMEDYLTAFPDMKQAHDKYVEQCEYFMIVDNVKSMLDKGRALIVVLDKEHYIVVQGDETNIYDNDSLPYHLREKIGLLKLVNDQQMISDVGCRLNAEAFVLVPEQEKA